VPGGYAKAAMVEDWGQHRDVRGRRYVSVQNQYSCDLDAVEVVI
jgi:hypothetical protein